jgi:RNA recognition motif-containing protein
LPTSSTKKKQNKQTTTMTEPYEHQQWYANTEEEDSGSGATSTISGRSEVKQNAEAIKDDPTNLIVNYLPVYFDKDDLRAMFEPYGNIQSLIVMYNNRGQRKKSRGYGFVKFSTAKEAQAAIAGVDGTRFQHKTIKVSVARPGRARKCSNLFISRLPIDWETSDLERVFKPFGHIVECRVLKFTDGVSRRCGFVRYDKDEEAQQALRKMRDFRPSPEAQPFQVNLSVNHSPDVRRKFFDSHDYHEVNSHFSSTFNRDYFNEYGQSRYGGYDDHHYDDFGGYGPPMGARPYQPHYPRYRNEWDRPSYGGYREQKWSTYEEPARPSYQRPSQPPAAPAPAKATPAAPAAAAPTAAAPAPASEQPETAPPAAVADKTRFFVKNLPEFYDESNLKSLFSSYGEVAEVTVQRDRNGKSMQCAFIVFAEAAGAKKAVDALDGVFLCSDRIQINFV